MTDIFAKPELDRRTLLRRAAAVGLLATPLPPAAVTRAVTASASSVAMYVLQAVGWPTP